MTIRSKSKGKAESAKGRSKSGVGRATGNEQWRTEGLAGVVKGNLRQAAAKVRDAFRR